MHKFIMSSDMSLKDLKTDIQEVNKVNKANRGGPNNMSAISSTSRDAHNDISGMGS